MPPAETSVTPPMPRSLQAPVRNGVVLLVSLLAIGACTANGPLAPSKLPDPIMWGPMRTENLINADVLRQMKKSAWLPAVHAPREPGHAL